MSDEVTRFETDGVVVVDSVLSVDACDDALALIDGIDGTGTRRLLDHPAIRQLAAELRCHPLLAPLLPADAACIQCTLFAKGGESSWGVGAHQDLSVPVAFRIDAAGFGGWAEKEGQLFVQPPVVVLASLVAVRVQLDDHADRSGPLEVVPGSHHHRLSADHTATFDVSRRIACVPPRGGAVVMRPLLVHASAKGDSTLPRRVLHFVFAPRRPPYGLAWAEAV